MMGSFVNTVTNLLSS